MKSFWGQRDGKGAASNSSAPRHYLRTSLIRPLLLVIILLLIFIGVDSAPGIKAGSDEIPLATPRPTPVSESIWHTFTSSRFGYSLTYPPFLSPSEKADQSPGKHNGVPSNLALGNQVTVISRIPPLPDDVVRRYWGEGTTVRTVENHMGKKIERVSRPIGGGAPVVTIQYLFRAAGADYILVANLPTDAADQNPLGEADIERIARSFRILPDRDYNFTKDTVTADLADAFDFFVDPPDGGTRAPEYASYNVQNPYLNYWSTCYNKTMSQLQHAGEDWFRAAGTNVYAVANGRVVWANYANWPGAVVIIEHTLANGWTNPWEENSIYSVYGHLSTSGLVSQWSDVSRGQVIGQVYNQSANSHIHFEMRRYGDMSDILFCPATGYSSWPGPGYTDTNVDPGTYGYVNPSAWIDNHRLGTCYDLNMGVNPPGSGNVDITPPPNCNNETQYLEGTEITVTAVADNPSYTFFSWSDDSEGTSFTDEPITVIMAQDHNISANFIPADEVLLSVETTDMVVPLGDEATVEIVASNISGLYGAQMELHFDPAKVEVVDADSSSAGIQVTPGACPAPDMILMNSVDNANGIINYAATALAPSQPCDGGLVMSITLRGLTAPQISSLHFTDWQLSDSDGLEVPAHARGGTLNILETSLEGNVLLQGRSDHSGVTVCADDGDDPICAETGADGHYALVLGPGNYLVTVHMERYLDAERNVLLTAGTSTSLPDVSCPGGDSNNDCVINILDLGLLGGRFGVVCDDTNWDQRADINDDCAVNILDLALAGGNFSKNCPAAWP